MKFVVVTMLRADTPCYLVRLTVGRPWSLWSLELDAAERFVSEQMAKGAIWYFQRKPCAERSAPFLNAAKVMELVG